MIKEKLNTLRARVNPILRTKYKDNNEVASHLSKPKIVPQKDYEYYICDCCGEEINMSKKKDERDGGKVGLPGSLTKTNSIIILALHDRCLNKVLNELEPRE